MAASGQKQRVNFIEELSAYIEDAKCNIRHLLQDLGWDEDKLLEDVKTQVTGENQGLLHCPYDAHHRVKAENMEEHIKLCRLRSASFENISKKEIPESSSWCYNSLSPVTQVFLGKAQFDALGITFEKKESKNKEELKTSGQELFTEVNSAMITEKRQNLKQFSESIEDNSSTSPDLMKSPTEELKYIYTWSRVPGNYRHIDMSVVDTMTVKAWLVENIPENKLRNVAGADVKLMDFIIDSLRLPGCHPDNLVTKLKDLFFQETPKFVLNLWKFLWAASLCTKHNISEVVRRESEMLGFRSRKQSTVEANPAMEPLQPLIPALDSPSLEPEASLPVNVMMSYMTPEQRLKLYEFVVQTGKSRGVKSTFTVEDLEKQSEEQMNAVMILEQGDDGPRTHLEAMAELRDYKRRRQTYRARNQHINRRSATDVVRELIDQQTKYLEFIGGKKVSTDVPDEMQEEAPEAGSDSDKSSRTERWNSREERHRDRPSDSRDYRELSRSDRHDSQDRGSRGHYCDDRRDRLDRGEREDGRRKPDRWDGRERSQQIDGRDRSDRRDREARRSRDHSRERLVEGDRHRSKRYSDRDWRDDDRKRDSNREEKRHERYSSRRRHRDKDAVDKDRKRSGNSRESSPHNPHNEKSEVTESDVSENLKRIRNGLELCESDDVFTSATDMSNARIPIREKSHATLMGSDGSISENFSNSTNTRISKDTGMPNAFSLYENKSNTAEICKNIKASKYDNILLEEANSSKGSLNPDESLCDESRTLAEHSEPRNGDLYKTGRENVSISRMSTTNSKYSALDDINNSYSRQELSGKNSREHSRSRSRSSSDNGGRHKKDKQKHKHKHKKSKHKHKSKKRKYADEVY